MRLKKYKTFSEIPEDFQRRLLPFKGDGDPDIWLKEPVPALEGRSILQTLNSWGGEKKVEEYLLKIEGYFG